MCAFYPGPQGGLTVKTIPQGQQHHPHFKDEETNSRRSLAGGHARASLSLWSPGSRVQEVLVTGCAAQPSWGPDPGEASEAGEGFLSPQPRQSQPQTMSSYSPVLTRPSVCVLPDTGSWGTRGRSPRSPAGRVTPCEVGEGSLWRRGGTHSG